MFGCCGGYVGLSWVSCLGGYVGCVGAYVGLPRGYIGLSGGYVGLSWGYVGLLGCLGALEPKALRVCLGHPDVCSKRPGSLGHDCAF